MEGVIIVTKEIAIDASMDANMDANMDATTDVTLKRKADNIGGDDATPTTTLLKRIRQFGEDVEKWDDTMDANWVREEIDGIMAMAMEILAAEDAAKKPKNDSSTCTTTPLDTIISTVPIVTATEIHATEIQIAPEMSMTLLQNGKDTIVKAANDSVNNAYEVLLYGPKEMSDNHRIALRDISNAGLQILNIVGVPFMRKSAHYPYVEKIEDAKEIIDAWAKEKATFSNPITTTPAATTPAATITTPTITTPATDSVGETHPEGLELLV